MKVRSTKIMGEITKITEGIATKGNYDLILDKSAQALRSNQVLRVHEAQHGHHPLRDEGTQQGRSQGL